ncbi:hypothetical protein M426DRAFT_70650 [Hypoxylon sp. CI-4A]|nr:hypothetical protein M426DRAFT_70650 [Hypoxylon sp. CI-4A]
MSPNTTAPFTPQHQDPNDTATDSICQNLQQLPRRNGEGSDILGRWAYVLSGRVCVTALDVEGGSFVGDVEKGDLWYFPAGFPHSLTGLGPGGEDSTFLLGDFMAHVPQSVLAKNFRLAPEVFESIPKKERYIFAGSKPKPIRTDAGEVRITDTSLFPVSKTVSAAHVMIKPGGISEMHWHPNADEWSYFIRGPRVTIFAPSNTARTFDYTAGDVDIVPKSMGHYVENISDTEEFEDFNLEQWLASSPARNVAEHLFQASPKAGEQFVKELHAEKRPVKPKL